MNSDNVFKALSDANRRKIIKLLRKKSEMTAGEIAEQFSISQPAVSDHLKILRNAGLVYSEKKGQYVEYSLNATVLEELMMFFYDFINNKEKGE